ncbi:hypothetical protein Hamer_G025057, partial [Homarus americanus]
SNSDSLQQVPDGDSICGKFLIVTLPVASNSDSPCASSDSPVPSNSDSLQQVPDGDSICGKFLIVTLPVASNSDSPCGNYPCGSAVNVRRRLQTGLTDLQLYSTISSSSDGVEVLLLVLLY